MSTLRDNIAAMDRAKSAVLAHPMCLRLNDEGTHYVIMYPEGDFPVDGLRVVRSALGLRMALEKMEKHWMESYP